MYIDAHLHLWDKQQGRVDGKPVYSVGGGRSYFGGEVLQMQPPYMIDGANCVEALMANMDYAGVSGCVVTQEYIDGNQDDYLLAAKAKYPDRMKICSLYEENAGFKTDGFDGIKLCAGRLADKDLTHHMNVFKKAEECGLFISIDMAEGDVQVGQLQEIVDECPDLRVAIGHFGMVTVDGWKKQIALACNKNVRVESGGITWLFNSEFYPFAGAVRAIKEAAEICGMEKLMWGSDYPRTMTEITYKMSLNFVLKSDLSDEDKKMFLGENAKAFYGFADLAVPPHIKNILE